MTATLRIAGLWERLWFVKDSAFNLAMMRIIVSAHALWVILSRDLPAISGVPELWTEVPQTLKLRYMLFPGHASLEWAIQALTIIALLCALSGVLARVGCLVAAVGIYHLAPLETIIWAPFPLGRGLTIAPIALVVLSVTRSTDALSLYPRPAAEVSPSTESGWPRRLILLLVAQIYLFSVFAKLRVTGLDWASAENMKFWFLSYWFYDDMRIFRPLSFWISQQERLLAVVGWSILIFETTFVVAVFSSRSRLVLVPLALAFQVLVGLTLGFFVSEALLVVLFINWDRVLSRVGAVIKKRAPVATPEPSLE